MRQVANLVLADTGSMKIKVDEVLKKNGVTRSKLAKIVGVDYRVINRLCGGEAMRVDLDLLTRICYAMECDLADIMEYIPPKEKPSK